MTPLAKRIVEQRLLPLKKRTFRDGCGLLQRMDDIHCFEVSEVLPLARQIATQLAHMCARMPGEYLELMNEATFLPAVRTWIEFRQAGLREGVLLEAMEGDLPGARTYWAVAGGPMFRSANAHGALLLCPPPLHGDLPLPKPLHGITDAQTRGWVFMLYALLCIINSPRSIGRRQHMPNLALAARLLRKRKLIGHFPLRAWTEIKLEAFPDVVADDDKVHRAHLTGDRCLHYCRAHLRIQNGMVVFVHGHWRGNAALGIKQSRYRITPPRWLH